MADSDDQNDRGEGGKRSVFSRAVSLWKERKKKGRERQPGVIKFRTNFRNTIYDVFRGRGYIQTDNETDWDIYWANRDWIRGVYDKVHLDVTQRVNHFRNYYELTRKDLLIKNLKRAKRTLSKKGREEESKQYDFFPQTFGLPGEYLLFVEAFKQSPPGTLWIMKPIGKSQGKGIFLFDKLNQISDWKNDFRWKPENPQAEKYIVQRYIHNPLLIGGKKFDLRIYVLCTSYQPLTVYMHREGFARFTSERFSMTHNEIQNSYIHLTNVAVQKKGAHYDSETGGKWDVRGLKLYLISKFGHERVNQLFSDIQLCCIRSLLSVQKVVISDKNSFELYGYDILIDADLKVWLLEVNASPSLTANTQKDYNMKYAMLNDVLTIIDLEKKLTGNEEQIGGFDLIYRNGFVKFDQNCTFTTYLGAHNNRIKQLRKLDKSLRKLKQSQQAQASEAGGSADKEQKGDKADKGGADKEGEAERDKDAPQREERERKQASVSKEKSSGSAPSTGKL